MLSGKNLDKKIWTHWFEIVQTSFSTMKSSILWVNLFRRSVFKSGYNQSLKFEVIAENAVPSLTELAAKCVASHIPFELVEHVYPPVPEQLQLRIAFWSFPDNEEDIRFVLFSFFYPIIISYLTTTLILDYTRVWLTDRQMSLCVARIYTGLIWSKIPCKLVGFDSLKYELNDAIMSMRTLRKVSICQQVCNRPDTTTPHLQLTTLPLHSTDERYRHATVRVNHKRTGVRTLLPFVWREYIGWVNFWITSNSIKYWRLMRHSLI